MGKPAIAENDGDKPNHDNAGKDFTAEMRAARGKLLELGLNRFGNTFSECPAALGQRKDDLPAFTGQFDESV